MQPIYLYSKAFPMQRFCPKLPDFEKKKTSKQEVPVASQECKRMPTPIFTFICALQPNLAKFYSGSSTLANGYIAKLAKQNNKILIIIILYIKATVFVCVGSAWKILPVTARSLWCLSARSLWCLSICGDKQGKAGRPGQLLRGAGRGNISIKEILGENRGTCI